MGNMDQKHNHQNKYIKSGSTSPRGSVETARTVQTSQTHNTPTTNTEQKVVTVHVHHHYNPNPTQIPSALITVPDNASSVNVDHNPQYLSIVLILSNIRITIRESRHASNKVLMGGI